MYMILYYEDYAVYLFGSACIAFYILRTMQELFYSILYYEDYTVYLFGSACIACYILRTMQELF